MLDTRSLDNALLAGQAKANVCRKWCRVGATVEDATYDCFHNGLGNSDTDHQRIHNSKRLELSEDALSALLARWIGELHKPGAARFDLNEGAV